MEQFFTDEHYIKLLEKYGEQSLAFKFLEELGELEQAVAKHSFLKFSLTKQQDEVGLAKISEWSSNIEEEIADVLLVIDTHLSLVEGSRDRVRGFIEAKNNKFYNCIPDVYGESNIVPKINVIDAWCHDNYRNCVRAGHVVIELIHPRTREVIVPKVSLYAEFPYTRLNDDHEFVANVSKMDGTPLDSLIRDNRLKPSTDMDESILDQYLKK